MLAKLTSIRELTSAEELVMDVRYGGMPVATAERSMRLFAAEVLPALQQLDAPLAVEVSGSA